MEDEIPRVLTSFHMSPDFLSPTANRPRDPKPRKGRGKEDQLSHATARHPFRPSSSRLCLIFYNLFTPESLFPHHLQALLLPISCRYLPGRSRWKTLSRQLLQTLKRDVKRKKPRQLEGFAPTVARFAFLPHHEPPPGDCFVHFFFSDTTLFPSCHTRIPPCLPE